MRKFVLDTSLFVNPQTRKKFGKDASSAVKGFVKIVRKLNAEFYMSPLVFKELENFISEKAMEELEIVVKRKAPNIYAIYLPAAIMYDFIEDVRKRINKGLRLSEQFAKDNRPDNDEKLRKLRDRYRDAMRTGIVDSKEDFQLLLLSKELEATLVTSDEGMINFANKIGCETLNAEKMYALLKKMK